MMGILFAFLLFIIDIYAVQEDQVFDKDFSYFKVIELSPSSDTQKAMENYLKFQHLQREYYKKWIKRQPDISKVPYKNLLNYQQKPTELQIIIKKGDKEYFLEKKLKTHRKYFKMEKNQGFSTQCFLGKDETFFRFIPEKKPIHEIAEDENKQGEQYKNLREELKSLRSIQRIYKKNNLITSYRLEFMKSCDRDTLDFLQKEYFPQLKKIPLPFVNYEFMGNHLMMTTQAFQHTVLGESSYRNGFTPSSHSSVYMFIEKNVVFELLPIMFSKKAFVEQLNFFQDIYITFL